ncbi:hypothetical protein DFJ77DRAFT_52023 [Powellomyces hirtus]|nr:hypothetical protein DFJ77DRAFT_52023 [Powellomyces hirtus]
MGADRGNNGAWNGTPLRGQGPIASPGANRSGPTTTPMQARVLNISSGWSPSMETPSPGKEKRAVTPGRIANLLRAQHAGVSGNVRSRSDIGILRPLDMASPIPHTSFTQGFASELAIGNKNFPRWDEDFDVEPSTPTQRGKTTSRRKSGLPDRKALRTRPPLSDPPKATANLTPLRPSSANVKPLRLSEAGDKWLGPFLGDKKSARPSSKRPKRKLLKENREEAVPGAPDSHFEIWRPSGAHTPKCNRSASARSFLNQNEALSPSMYGPPDSPSHLLSTKSQRLPQKRKDVSIQQRGSDKKPKFGDDSTSSETSPSPADPSTPRRAQSPAVFDAFSSDDSGLESPNILGSNDVYSQQLLMTYDNKSGNVDSDDKNRSISDRSQNAGIDQLLDEYDFEDQSSPWSFLDRIDQQSTEDVQMAHFMAASGKELALAPNAEHFIINLFNDSLCNFDKASFVPQTLADLRNIHARQQTKHPPAFNGGGSPLPFPRVVDGAHVHRNLVERPETPVRIPTPILTGITSDNHKSLLPKDSDNAQAHARELGLDDDMSPDYRKHLESSDTPVGKPVPVLTGFTSGNGKSLPKVSDNAQSCARKLGFEDALTDIAPDHRKHVGSSDTPVGKPVPVLTGFTSGNGKSLPKVSDNAQSCARKLGFEDALTDISPDHRQHVESFETPVSKPIPVLAGFTSGNGKRLPKISDDAQSYARKLGFDDVFTDMPPDHRNRMENFSTPVSKPISTLAGFTSGNGKSLPKLSDHAQSYARKLGFDDVFTDMPPDHRNCMENISTPVSKPVSMLAGFTSGNGKSLPKLSDHAQSYARKLGFDDVFTDMPPDYRNCMENFSTPVSKPVSILTGFTSGNGKSLPKISDHAQSHARRLGFDVFTDMPPDHSDHAGGFETPVSKPLPILAGFTSGNGKSLPNISDKAQTYARKLGFDNAFNEMPPDTPVAKIGRAPATNGFFSGTGKALPQLSTRAQQKAFTMGFGDELLSGVCETPLTKHAVSKRRRLMTPADLESGDQCLKPPSPISLVYPDSHADAGPTKEGEEAALNDPEAELRIGAEEIPALVMVTSQDTPTIVATAVGEGNRENGGQGKVFKLSESLLRTPVVPQTPTPLGRKATLRTPMSSNKKKFQPLNLKIKQNSAPGTPCARDGFKKIVDLSREVHLAVNKKAPLALFDVRVDAPRQSLREAFGRHRKESGVETLLEMGVGEDLVFMTSLKAQAYKFSASDSSLWGAKEARAALLAMGALPNLATEEWTANHYRWIVWQLASMVRSFPNLWPTYWQTATVLDRLRYRYEREINRAERSAIKLIVERDNVPDRYTVLCVSRIAQLESSTTGKAGWDIELTDGWYMIKASIDSPLSELIREGKIANGMKLRLCNAQLLGTADACPILEATDDTRLRLSANGTRRAPWDAMLGYQRARNFVVGLRQIIPNGGMVPCIDVVICRRYALRYYEKLPDGRSIFHNQKEEEEAAMLWQRAYNKALQSVVNDVERTKRNTGESSRPNERSGDGISQLQDPEELQWELEMSSDPAAFATRLRADQRSSLDTAIRISMEKHQAQLRDEINDRMETVAPPRNVTQFITIRICDYPPDGIQVQKTREGILTIWNPDEALVSRLQEGKRFKIFNLMPKDNTRDNRFSVSLRAQRNSKYIELPITESRLADSLYTPRTVLRADHLSGVMSQADVDLVLVILGTWSSWTRKAI